MTEIVVADIGGTYARFAIADISDTNNIALTCNVTMETASHPSMLTAWLAYEEEIARKLPRKGAIAVAGRRMSDLFYNNSTRSRFINFGP